MPLFKRKKTIGVKAEVTYGTVETITAAEAMRCHDFSFDADSTAIEREKSTGGLGTDTSVPSGTKLMLAFKNFVHGDGGTGDPAWAAALFPTVGMIQTSNSYATSIIAASQASWKGLTAAANVDGRRIIGRGGMGNLKQIWIPGKATEFEWNYILAAVASPTLRTDTAQLSGISFESAVPPVWQGAGSLTIDSVTTNKVSKVEIDLNNQPYAREDPVAVGGYIGGYIQGAKPRIKMDIESLAVSSKDWHTAYFSALEITIILVCGSATGNVITTTATLCQLASLPKEGDRNGMLIDNLDFQVNGTLTTAFT